MQATIYDRLGARPVVNCRGVYSELGGAIIGPKVWAAMTEANGTAASMSELLEATGTRLARLLGAQAGRVTPGGAAAIALGTAACMTRGDGAASERLPDTTGLPDEVVLQRVQLPHYKYARVIRMPGARLRLVDSREELEQALDPERVAAVFVPAHLDEQPGALPLPEVAGIARKRGVPTLVDAAFLNYPPESMRRFTEEGADLVCFSAKYFYGPNTGGFVVGRADLVAAIGAVDFTNFETGRWAKFGRPFKLERLQENLAHVNRMATDLAHLTDSWQPAVLQLVAITAEAGRQAGKPVGGCGEAAADPLLACVLVGMGITSLSMASAAVRPVGARLASASMDTLEDAAEAALAANDPMAARDAVRRVLDA